MRKELILSTRNDFEKSVALFQSSVLAYRPFEAKMAGSAHVMLEYDAMSFRFQKLVEMGAHFFRSVEKYFLKDESATYRDCLLRMEKLLIIDSAEVWSSARDLRNKIAHEYDPERLERIYADMFLLGEKLLGDMARVDVFLAKNL
jgi:uncharacterized protein YutE (UPF0331/DUF86 family)